MRWGAGGNWQEKVTEVLGDDGERETWLWELEEIRARGKRGEKRRG